MEIFRGSATALVTPFHPDGKINFETLAKLLDFQIENDTDAIVICGTTGEASTLTDEEQLECIRFTVDYVNKRIPVIAGAGSNDTAHGVNLCVDAQNCGADALLLVTPYYNKCSQRGLVKHFTAQAEAVDIPVILYNDPARTGLNMLPATVFELSRVKNIVGLKEACGDIVQVAETARLCGKNFAIYSGNDDYTVPLMSVGGLGIISVIANVAPKKSHEMTRRYFAGDIEGAAALQLEMLPLVRALFIPGEVSPGPVKAALKLMGIDAGGHRLPVCEPDEKNIETIRGEMINYGLITA